MSSNTNLIAHEKTYKFLSHCFKNKISPSSWIIAGKKSIGKSKLVYKIAREILGDKYNDIHPDLMVVNQENNDDITVDEIRKLHKFIRVAPAISSHKIVIIDDCHKMNINASNALLKILEEPHNSIFFLISHNLHQLPSTILSRCNKVRLDNLSHSQALSVILQLEPEIDKELISKILIFADNSISLALELHKINILDLYQKLLNMALDIGSCGLVEFNKFYDSIKCEDNWEIFCLLINRLLLQIIKQGAGIEPIITEEKNIIEKITKRCNIESLIDLWDKLQNIIHETTNAYLDQKQVILVIFQLMQQNLR